MAATTVVDHYISSDDEESSVDYEDTDDAQGNFVETHDNYLNDLASHLNQLRKAETLCDMTIVVNNRRFPVHKAILCAASSYFSAMFTSGFQESSQSEIEIDGNGEAFERLLNFAYTGVISLNTELIGDIISTASYLQFNKVVPLCSRFLKRAYARKLVPLPDAFTILNMAITHKFPALQKHAETYLAKHFVEFSEMSVFLRDASSDYVKSVLYRKDLVRWAREEKIFNGTVAWLKHNWEGRQKYAGQFLKLIRLGLVPIDNLKERMDSDLQAIPECREMVEEVEKCLALKESSKTPLSFQFPDLFASRGTVTTLISINTAASHHTWSYDESGWQSLPLFPNVPFNQPFEGHRLIIAKGQLYLVGGRFMTDLIPSYARQPMLIEVCDFFFRYDAENNEWEPKEGMGVARSHCATVALGDHIYVIGGWSSVLGVQVVQRFNVIEDKWETLAPIPTCFSIPVAVVFRNKIIVHQIKSGSGRHQLGHLMWYDHVKDKWHNLMSYTMQSSRSRRMSLAPLLVVHEDRFYVVSYNSGVACVQEFEFTLEDEDRVSVTRLKELQDSVCQEEIGKQGPRAFCIRDQQFANLNGYPYKLHPWVLQQFACSPKKTLRNLIEQLGKEGCCLEFDLDCYSLKSEGPL